MKQRALRVVILTSRSFVRISHQALPQSLTQEEDFVALINKQGAVEAIEYYKTGKIVFGKHLMEFTILKQMSRRSNLICLLNSCYPKCPVGDQMDSTFL